MTVFSMCNRTEKRASFFMFLMILPAVFLFTSCASNLNSIELEEPKPVVRPEPDPAPGAIWAGENTNNMLFADKKARYINDIITVIIQESSTGVNKASTDTSRDSSTSVGVEALLGLEQKILEQNTRMGSSISLGGKSASALKGEGDTSRENKLTSTLTARVIDVLNNGHLVIQGKRQVTINAEEQFIVLTGIVRPEDVTYDNTVSSKYIADARIMYTGKGVVNDKMRPGWLTRAADWVWPF